MLYATDWTTGVDGAARVQVALVVEAHHDALAACFAPDEAARIEVTFGWAGGKPVQVASDGSGSYAECVEREVASWRADVGAPGPFTWELVRPGPPPPPRSPLARGGHLQPPERGELQTTNPKGFRLVIHYTIAPEVHGRAFVEGLEAKLPAISACDLSELLLADQTGSGGWFQWNTLYGRVVRYRDKIEVGAGAACLEDELRGLPMGSVHYLMLIVIPPPG